VPPPRRIRRGGGLAEAEPELVEGWEREQREIAGRVVCDDSRLGFDGGTCEGLERVGGVDISFVKDNSEEACATLVVLGFPSMEVMYEVSRPVRMKVPYVPGFLAFRECADLLEILEELKRERPEAYPQVIMVDGSGLLHHRMCGLACHLGVLSDTPSLGVAKNLLACHGLTKKGVADAMASLDAAAEREGQPERSLPLIGSSGRVLGAAVRVGGSKGAATNPVFVSLGHRMSLETAVGIVTRTSTSARVPEPIRQADLRSREFLQPLGRQLPPPAQEP